MDPLTLHPLASSSAGNAYVLAGGGTKRPLLIECGLSQKVINGLLWTKGFTMSSLAGCVVSHSHGDHSKAMLALAERAVDCYATRPTIEAVAKGNTQFSHRIHAIEASADGETYPEFGLDDWRVKPFAVQHDCPGTVGFYIGAPNGERFLYVTDAAWVPNRFEGLTLIAIEANHDTEIIRQRVADGSNLGRNVRAIGSHMDIDRTIKALQANDLSKVRKIWLLHLSAENSDASEFQRRVITATGVPTEVAAH